MFREEVSRTVGLSETMSERDCSWWEQWSGGWVEVLWLGRHPTATDWQTHTGSTPEAYLRLFRPPSQSDNYLSPLEWVGVTTPAQWLGLSTVEKYPTLLVRRSYNFKLFSYLNLWSLILPTVSKGHFCDMIERQEDNAVLKELCSLLQSNHDTPLMCDHTLHNGE